MCRMPAHCPDQPCDACGCGRRKAFPTVSSGAGNKAEDRPAWPWLTPCSWPARRPPRAGGPFLCFADPSTGSAHSSQNRPLAAAWRAEQGLQVSCCCSAPLAPPRSTHRAPRDRSVPAPMDSSEGHVTSRRGNETQKQGLVWEQSIGDWLCVLTF